MFKKVFLTTIITCTWFANISLWTCTTEIPTSSYQWCQQYDQNGTRYCNQETAFTLRESKNQGTYKRSIQKESFQQYLATKNLKYSFSTSDICAIQKEIGVSQDGKLWNETISKILSTSFCTGLNYASKNKKWQCDEWEEEHGCCYIEPEAINDDITLLPDNEEEKQQDVICGEHAYTCLDGTNATETKYNEKEKTCTRKCWETACPEEGETVKCSTYASANQTLWIWLNKDCLVHGWCSLDVYKTLWIRQNSSEETRTSVLSFFQDIIGASTFFIGTILTIAFVISGFRYVMAGANGSDPAEAKKGIKYSIIGFILVMTAYAIIRFIQYLASTGG